MLNEEDDGTFWRRQEEKEAANFSRGSHLESPKCRVVAFILGIRGDIGLGMYCLVLGFGHICKTIFFLMNK